MTSIAARYVKGSDVSAAFVVSVGDVGRVNGKRIVVVCVMRTSTKALTLPHAWDDDLAPRRGVEAGGPEITGPFEGRASEVELPFTGQTKTLGFAGIVIQGISGVLVDEETAPRRESVPMEDLEVVPVWHRRGKWVGWPTYNSADNGHSGRV